MAGPGVACGLLSIPLRYMHTPGEVVDLNVVEQSVQLLVEFARRVKKKQSYSW
jgi:endoglucanase